MCQNFIFTLEESPDGVAVPHKLSVSLRKIRDTSDCCPYVHTTSRKWIQRNNKHMPVATSCEFMEVLI